MKIVVIGGTGLIGGKLVQRLARSGHEVLAASPNTGVNTLTGEGLDRALAGAQVVVDVANSPSFEDAAVLSFFQTATINLLAAGLRAGVRHQVALSVVGTGRLQASGYFRAKLAQETLIRNAPIPFSLVHSTQFFEFIGGIVQSGSDGQVVRLPPASIQAISSDDVADAMHEVCVGAPRNATVEIAGPQRMRLAELARRFLAGTGDGRRVVEDAHARYFGAELDELTLVPGDGARLGVVRFEDWFAARP